MRADIFYIQSIYHCLSMLMQPKTRDVRKDTSRYESCDHLDLSPESTKTSSSEVQTPAEFILTQVSVGFQSTPDTKSASHRNHQTSVNHQDCFASSSSSSSSSIENCEPLSFRALSCCPFETRSAPVKARPKIAT